MPLQCVFRNWLSVAHMGQQTRNRLCRVLENAVPDGLTLCDVRQVTTMAQARRDVPALAL